jgi:protein TonB
VPLETEQRTRPDAPSALARWTFPASLAFHAAAVAAAILLALWSFAPAPEEEPVKVTVVSERVRHAPGPETLLGDGSRGASGGTEGAAPPTSAGEARSAMARVAVIPPAGPAEAPSPSPLAIAAEPEAPPREAPEPRLATTAVLPAPPPRKPQPPRRDMAAAAPPLEPPHASAAKPEPQPVAAAAPIAPQRAAAAPTAGLGGGRGGEAGAGASTAGAGLGTAGRHAGPGDDYLDKLRRWLRQYRHYPEDAKQQKQQGEVVVSFTIRRDGTVLDPRVEQGSGFPALDAAALQMLRDASPVPPLPATYPGAQVGVQLPVAFSLGLLDRVF